MKRDEALKRYSETMRMMRYSGKTIDAYRDWAGQFITFLFTCKPGTPREDQVGAFLTKIVVKKNISANTQKQALCAIILFARLVLKEQIGDIVFRPASRAKRPPVVLSREECWRVMDRLDGVGWLWGAYMWGCGLRLDEVCNLRVKDVDIDRRQVSVRDGKGGKDRIVALPEGVRLIDALVEIAAAMVPHTEPETLLLMIPEAGIDLKKAVLVDRPYLETKTSAELDKLVKEFGIKNIMEGAPGDYPADWKHCNVKQRVDQLLRHDLTGKLPKDIAERCDLKTLAGMKSPKPVKAPKAKKAKKKGTK